MAQFGDQVGISLGARLAPGSLSGCSGLRAGGLPGQVPRINDNRGVNVTTAPRILIAIIIKIVPKTRSARCGTSNKQISAFKFLATLLNRVELRDHEWTFFVNFVPNANPWPAELPT
jgi:hypothetical protein